jgi:hypothetical protein
MAKNRTHPPHPPGNPISDRHGCKVGWNTYATEAEAKAAAEWAKVEEQRKAELGYDFGYQSPGSISKVPRGWEVVMP